MFIPFPLQKLLINFNFVEDLSDDEIVIGKFESFYSIGCDKIGILFLKNLLWYYLC